MARLDAVVLFVPSPATSPTVPQYTNRETQLPTSATDVPPQSPLPRSLQARPQHPSGDHILPQAYRHPGYSNSPQGSTGCKRPLFPAHPHHPTGSNRIQPGQTEPRRTLPKRTGPNRPRSGFTYSTAEGRPATYPNAPADSTQKGRPRYREPPSTDSPYGSGFGFLHHEFVDERRIGFYLRHRNTARRGRIRHVIGR